MEPIAKATVVENVPGGTARSDLMRGLRQRLALSGWPLLLPAIGLYSVGLLYPLWLLLLRSFRDAGGEIGLTSANYVHIVTTPLFRSVLEHSLVTAVAVTVVCLVLGYPVAYLIYRSSPWLRRIYMAMLVLPLLTSVLIRSFAWVALLESRGPVNWLLVESGLIDRSTSLLYNQFSLMVGMVNVMLPYTVLPVYSTMLGIDKRFVPAAMSLGAGPTRAFWKVFWPLSLPGVSAGALLTFVLSLGFYITPALLGGRRETMIAQLIETQIKSLGAFETASALAITLMLFTVILLLIYSRIFGLTRVFGSEGLDR